MGLNSVPNVLYWSNCVIFCHYLRDRIFRNRYELIRYLHCIEVPDSSDKLCKVSNVMLIIMHIIK